MLNCRKYPAVFPSAAVNGIRLVLLAQRKGNFVAAAITNFTRATLIANTLHCAMNERRENPTFT